MRFMFASKGFNFEAKYFQITQRKSNNLLLWTRSLWTFLFVEIEKKQKIILVYSVWWLRYYFSIASIVSELISQGNCC